MSKVRKSGTAMRQDVGGDVGAVWKSPQRGNTFTSRVPPRVLPLLRGRYSYHLPPRGHTAPDSFKQPCKTATSTQCLCAPPPADTRLALSSRCTAA